MNAQHRRPKRQPPLPSDVLREVEALKRRSRQRLRGEQKLMKRRGVPLRTRPIVEHASVAPVHGHLLVRTSAGVGARREWRLLVQVGPGRRMRSWLARSSAVPAVDLHSAVGGGGAR